MTWAVVPGSPGGNQPNRATNPLRDARRDATPRATSIRVLVVDDEPSICKALGMALSHAGYEVLTARSGEAAFAVIDTEQIDVMLTDLRIPDMRGDVIFEYAAGVQPSLRHRTLFMTGDISDQAVELIAACRCNFIRKPFDLSLMLDAVAALSPRIDRALSSA